jgi:hypothetical protein
MKKALIVLGLVLVAAAVVVVSVIVLTPWMDQWGATAAELSMALPGDELLSQPASYVNRAVSINAAPEKIYPWLVQLGAEKGGYYSYSMLETYLLFCPLQNADRIHAEWQDLKVGDQVKMCPGSSGPPPYEVVQLISNRSMVLGHKENGQWVDVWMFNIVAQPDGTSRLILRTRTNAVGGFWDIIHPGVFIMERGMLLGIKERAEGLIQ